MHKRLALTLAIAYTLFITIMSLISLRNIPKLGSSFDDKIYHCGAYALLCVLVWYHFFEKTKSKYKILFLLDIALAYGIIIEILQGTFTTYQN